jgi:hypothetical protein
MVQVRPPASENLFCEATIERIPAYGVGSAAQKPNRWIVVGGRTWTICADSSVIDLMHYDNWRYAWKWNPDPWQTTMKVAGFDGTYYEWLNARPPREVEERLHRAPAPEPRTFDMDLDLEQAEFRAHMLRSAEQLDLQMTDVSGTDQSLPGFSGPRRVSTLDEREFVLPQLAARRSR